MTTRRRVIHDGWPTRERDLEQRIAQLEQAILGLGPDDGSSEEWEQVASLICCLNEELRLLQLKH